MKKLPLALLLFSLLCPTLRGGDRGGTGGDPLAAEFVARGRFVLEALRARPALPLLTPAKLGELEFSLGDTRVEFVDRQLPKLTAVAPDPTDPGSKWIQVSRGDWDASVRLNVDLVQKIFQAYLETISVDDTDDKISSRLPVTERDFQNRVRQNPDCPVGSYSPVRITFELRSDFVGLRAPAYINGIDFDPGDHTNSRTFVSTRLCSTKYYAFDVSIGPYYRHFELVGGAKLTIDLPSGRVTQE